MLVRSSTVNIKNQKGSVFCNNHVSCMSRPSFVVVIRTTPSASYGSAGQTLENIEDDLFILKTKSLP
jgi:hypothetical protein